MAAPAVRVGVLVGDVPEQQPALLEVLDQLLVGLLEELTADQIQLGQELPGGVDHVHHRHVVLAAAAEVLLTVRGGLVHQAGAVLGGDVVLQHDEVRVLVRPLDQLERPLVAPALQVGPAEPLGHGPALAERGLQQRFRHHQGLVPVGRGHVRHVAVRCDQRVRHECPRRRGPGQQCRLPGQRPGGEREPHVHRRVGDGLVSTRLAELVVGQTGPAARAVRRDPEVLDQQVGVEDLLQRPPDRVDVRRVHRPVGVVEVHPVAHPGGELLERVHVPQHRLAALRVELRDAVPLDVGPSRQPELLLHAHLDVQALAVPAGLPADRVPLHGPVAREQVLEHPRLDVVRAGHPVRGRRALVEVPRLAAGGVGQALLEGVVGLPEREHVALHRREVDLGRDLLPAVLVG